MRVAIDLTALLPERTGVDAYLLGLVRGLAEVDETTSYILFVNSGDETHFAGLPPNFTVRRGSLRPRPARLTFQQLLLPAYARRAAIDVVHSPAFITPQLRGGAGHVLSVHDLTSFSHPETHNHLRRSTPYRLLVSRSIRRADRICVLSRWVADELLAAFPDVPAERVRVVPPGIDARFTPSGGDEIADARERYGLRGPYLLFVGTLQPRKNLLGMLEAYRLLVVRRADAPLLVLAGGKGWQSDELERALAAPELAGRVVRTGYVPDDDLPALYSGAELFLYPSLAEGFGMPPFEALACGTAVVASSTSSLVENLVGAAELPDPHDHAALAAAIERLLDDPSARAAQIAEGARRARTFTWAELGRRVSAVYAELAGAR